MSGKSIGRVALVTGASRGIGAATVSPLASAGHRVALTYSSDSTGAERTVKDVEAAGGEAVRTYVQSGNVLFDASAADAPRIAAAIATQIRERLGHSVPVILLTAVEFHQIARANPYLAEEAPENELHVLLLSEAPEPDRIAKLDPDRSPPDRFTVAGRAVYHHAPNGVARSKLTNAYVDRALSVTSTARNWRTVGKLLALSSEE